MDFTKDGFLPPGDVELTLHELRNSMLVKGPQNGEPWDAKWRLFLVDQLEVMVQQLWTVGIDQIFIDGSFVEEKAHPNDIDAYFECDLNELASGELEQKLNALDSFKIWTWNSSSRKPYRGFKKNNCLCGTVIASSCIHISVSHQELRMSTVMYNSSQRHFERHGIHSCQKGL